MVRLFPLLIIGILVAYMDRANLGVVKAPMSADLGLTAGTFGLAAGVFYLGYLFFEIPSNIALHKLGARIWLARIMFTWGAVTVAFMFINGEMGLNILRFLLGVAEAGFYPGIILYLTFWFPGRLFSRAYSTFQLGVPVALAVTTLISSSILLLDGTFGIAGWRWVFLLQGACTLVLGFVYLFFLPNDPKKAKWLTQRERDYILEQVAASNPSGSAHERGAFAKVIRNGLAWVYASLYFCILMAFWTITYWLPTVIQERFGVSTVHAGFLSAIPWAFCALVMYLAGISAARTGDRRWHIIVGLLIGGSGLLLSTVFHAPIMVLICLCFAAAGAQAIAPLFFAQASTAFIGTAAAVSIAFVNSLGNLSGFIGPYVIGLLTDMTGDTRLGLTIMSAFFVFAAILTFYVTKKPTVAAAADNAVPMLERDPVM
ncbi:MFS transporter [Rhodococcus koreensis]